MADPIATPGDMTAVLGTPVDEDRAATLIELAQELCATIIDPVPATARSVVLDVAIAAYTNPAGVESEAAGPYPVTYGQGRGGLYLTKQQRTTLLRIAGRGGAFSIDPTPSTAYGSLLPWDLYPGSFIEVTTS